MKVSTMRVLSWPDSLPFCSVVAGKYHFPHFPHPLKEIQFVCGIFTPIVFSCHWCHVLAWTTATITCCNLSSLLSPCSTAGISERDKYL